MTPDSTLTYAYKDKLVTKYVTVRSVRYAAHWKHVVVILLKEKTCENATDLQIITNK